MNDASGHSAPAARVAPRNGQWCLIKLADAERQAAFVKEGAHEVNGYLSCIFRAAHTPSPVTITKDGKTETHGGEPVPDMLVLVTEKGHNLSVGVRNDVGHVEVKDVFFYPDSSAIAERAFATDATHLPPGRVFSSVWLERFHNHKSLPAEAHKAADGEMTPAAFLEQHAKV